MDVMLRRIFISICFLFILNFRDSAEALHLAIMD